jgi:hypothetical protein
MALPPPRKHHKLDFTGLLNCYFRPHEELVLQADEFRYNVLDIVADPGVPFESVDEPRRK